MMTVTHCLCGKEEMAFVMCDKNPATPIQNSISGFAVQAFGNS